MTRINTNVSSLIAQKTLARSNNQLQEALTRLSTGLRINVGKDDPAGLIASETLRSDIISVEKAITNSERANQLIGTADSALGQVSSLLNDIRGLVSEAANKGALSTDQIAANQLQLDSSLEAIDRISQVTSFQGRKLLDGSLNFITSGVDNTQISGLQIDQANFGTQTEIGVKVNVVAQATRGSLSYAFNSISEDVVLEIGGANGTEAFNFASGSTIDEIATAVNLVSDATGVQASVASEATKGQINVSSLGLDNDILLTANDAGFDEGDVRVKFSKGGTASTAVSYTASTEFSPALVDVQLRTTDGVAASGSIDDSSNLTAATATIDSGNANDDITFTAVTAGANGNDIEIVFVDDAAVTAGSEIATYNANTGTVTVQVDNGNTTANQVIQAVNTDVVVSEIVNAAVAGTDTGAGVVAATTTSLTGGEGDIDNDFLITANFEGTQFNDTDVHIVAGNATAAGITSLNTTATLTLSDDATNAALTFTSKLAGNAGNDIAVVFTEDANAATIAVVGNTISIKTDIAATTAADVVTLIEGDAAANALVSVVATNGASLVDDFQNTGQKLNNSHKATATEATTNAATISYTAKQAGPDGNDISIVYTANGANDIVVDGNTITVTALVGATAADVKALFDGNDAASALVDVTIDGITTGVVGAALVSLTTNLANGDPQAEAAEYSADAKAASTSLTFTNATTGDSENDIIITAANAGTAYNDVSVTLTIDSGLAANSATAAYDSANKVLNITIDNTAVDVTTIQTAVEGVQDGAGAQLFNLTFDDSAGDGDGTGSVDGASLAGSFTSGDEIANTANTGGEAGTLFLYTEEGVSTAQNVIDQLANAKSGGTGIDNDTARAADFFTVVAAPDNDGSGNLFALTSTDALSGGVKGGGVAADANEVIAAINSTSGLSDLVTATLSGSDDGKNVAVGDFQESGFYGTAVANNGLQFLGSTGSADVAFVAAAASQSLSITDNRGFAALTKDSVAANSALVFTAKKAGGDHDGVRINYVDDNNVTKGNETVTYDADNKVLTFGVATGNTAGNNTVASDVTAALLADDYASALFEASNFGTSDGTGEVDADLRQASLVTSFNAGVDELQITSDSYGTAGNAFTLSVVNTANAASVTFDANTGTITATVTVASTSVAELSALINTSLGDDFTAEVTKSETNAISATPSATAFTEGLGTDADANGVPDAATTDTVTDGGLNGTLSINLATDANGLVTTTANDLLAFFDDSANSTLLNEFGISGGNIDGSDGTGLLAATTSNIEFGTSGTKLVDQSATGTSTAVNGETAQVTVTADQTGAAFDDVSVVFVNDNAIIAGNEVASYDVDSKTLTVTIDETNTSAAQVVTAIDAQVGDLFTAGFVSGAGVGKVSFTDSLTLTGGVVDNGSVQGASLLGNEDKADTGLSFETTNFGSDQFVSVKALSGSFDLTDAAGAASDRSLGTDVNARINGIQAIGRGLKATLNTSSLDLSFTLDSTVTDGSEISFQITGGGAQFQLGPDVVSNQQARLGIQSVSTATLGGVNGRLFELRSGGANSLDNDANGAANIIDEVITSVTQLRGRLGAFQKTTLETNIFTLSDTLANLTDAESSIRDADFAAESANLTRAQILVQSGTSVLSIANSNPQNVLALLR